jgi:uncharacterized protein YkwD
MQEKARRAIIPSMCVRTKTVRGGRLLRYLCAGVAGVAILVAGIAGFDQRADASSYDSEELQFLDLINDYRENNGLESLVLSDTLAVAAERHSQDMARYSFFAHNTAASSYYPVGSAPWDRMVAEGYDYNVYKGENIAVGYASAEEAFAAWRRSPSHNRAMLDGRYRVIGIARIDDPDSVHGWYWTTDFGGALDPTSHAPGQNPQPEVTNDEPAPETQRAGEEIDGSLEDGPDVENGEMDGRAVWEQEARDGAELIVDGHVRLGDYDSGRDDLRQKIQVGENARLSYDVRIETNELRHPSDRLLVRLTDREGEQLAVLERYSDADAGGWRHETVDLSDFAGRTVYLSFLVETDPMLRTAFYLDKVSLEERP